MALSMLVAFVLIGPARPLGFVWTSFVPELSTAGEIARVGLSAACKHILRRSFPMRWRPA